MFLQTIAMAAAPTADGSAAQPSPIFSYVMMAFMVAIFYFAMIRPQRRREKERQAQVNALQSGQRVLLTSGILGEVAQVREKTLIVLVAEKTKIEVLKSAVAQRLEEKGDLPA
jgi:preprotein translocase subunit YajC